MLIYDCHSHLSFLELEEASLIISQAPSDYRWLLGGYEPSDWRKQILLKKKFPDKIYSCFGLHPWFIKSDKFEPSRDFDELKTLVDQADLIGEVGLDFFSEDDEQKKEMQMDLFERQLDLTQDKAFVLHIVQAHGKALEILKDYDIKGFVHAYSGSTEVAQQYFEMGVLLSFGPGVLNENFKKARIAVRDLPIEAILIESDMPSSPDEHEDPISLRRKVLNEVANIRQITVEELENQVSQNIQSLLD